MRAYIVSRKMRGQDYSAGLEAKRKILADYIRSNNTLAEHLAIVGKFLQNKYDFMEMLDHAKTLCIKIKPVQWQINVDSLVAEFNEKELMVVGEYLHAIYDYASGTGSFDSVDALASKLIRLIPIPNTIYAPPDSEFYKPKGIRGETLADAMEIV